MCIYSQLKSCSSSEVAAMIEGVLCHETEMDVEKNYVDTHGQSEVGFAFGYLLGFELLPHLKKQRLYRPNKGDGEPYANVQAILIRPIQWELIAAQFDEVIKFATALRLGTADAEAILRRFTRSNVQHPTYKALGDDRSWVSAAGRRAGGRGRMGLPCGECAGARLARELTEGL